MFMTSQIIAFLEKKVYEVTAKFCKFIDQIEVFLFFFLFSLYWSV